jgi:hypothetical protein
MPIVTANPDGAIRRFSAALDTYPAGFSGNRLNLLLVDDAEPIYGARAYLRQLDDLALLEERREYLLDEHSPWPFPRISLDHRPDPWLISEQLFKRFEKAKDLLPIQQQIGRILEERVRQANPAIVALVIVDGLSYYDLPDEQSAVPCLVAGISVTEYGYRAVIGNPSVSRRLFALGYIDQLAFTYFPPERDGLSADIHDTFSSSQVMRVRSFDEVLAEIDKKHLVRGYVQVVLSGLDQICHAHRDRPPREHYLNVILSRFDELIDCMSMRRKNRSILACLTADHGILWRDAVEDRIQIADDLFQEDIRSPRYLRGTLLRKYGRPCRSFDQNFTLLKAPWMTRGFRNNEWGVHGGISAWESIVPLMIRQSSG